MKIPSIVPFATEPHRHCIELKSVFADDVISLNNASVRGSEAYFTTSISFLEHLLGPKEKWEPFLKRDKYGSWAR